MPTAARCFALQLLCAVVLTAGGLFVRDAGEPAFARMRAGVKRQSESWAMDSMPARERLYRSLYGGRAVVEEGRLVKA